jgi:hypothetical protein
VSSTKICEAADRRTEDDAAKFLPAALLEQDERARVVRVHPERADLHERTVERGASLEAGERDRWSVWQSRSLCTTCPCATAQPSGPARALDATRRQMLRRRTEDTYWTPVEPEDQALLAGLLARVDEQEADDG